MLCNIDAKIIFMSNLQELNIPNIAMLRGLSALFKECVIYLPFLPAEISLKSGLSSLRLFLC